MRCALICSMLEAINSWIQGGCNYLQGVALYNQYGKDAYLQRIFKKSESDFNRKKLNIELVKLRDQAPPPVIVSKLDPVPSKAEATQPAQVNIPLPKLLQVTKERDTNYAEIRGLHPYLVNTDEGESLRELAERIVRLGKRNAALWQQYNYLTENPEAAALSEPIVKPVMIDLNLINEAEAVRKSLNKAEIRYDKQNPKNAKTLALINERRQQLEALKAQIAQIKAGGGE
jgi:hypothetical protein